MSCTVKRNCDSDVEQNLFGVDSLFSKRCRMLQPPNPAYVAPPSPSLAHRSPAQRRTNPNSQFQPPPADQESIELLIESSKRRKAKGRFSGAHGGVLAESNMMMPPASCMGLPPMSPMSPMASASPHHQHHAMAAAAAAAGPLSAPASAGPSPRRCPTCGKDGRPEETFSIDQVRAIVDAALKERDVVLQAEYDKILDERLQEQYSFFLKFNEDHIHRQLSQSDCSYMS